MALNCSHISEDNLASPVRIVNGYLMEGVSEKKGEVYSRPWHVSRVEGDERNFSCGRDRVDCCSSSEATSKDIVDLLPSDPFGMDIETTFTAITGWLEDCGGYMRSNNGVVCEEGYGLFAGWNLILNNSFKFQPSPCTIQLNERLNTGVEFFPTTCKDYFPSGCQFDQKVIASHTLSTDGDERGVGIGSAPYDVGFRPACNVGNVESASCNLDMGSTGNGFRPACNVRDVESTSCNLDMGSTGNVFRPACTAASVESASCNLDMGSTVNGFRPACNVGDVGSASCNLDMGSTGKVECASEFEGAPHEAFNYVLSYLGVKDLLSVERVCSSLSSAVRGDPLFWKTIHIDQPLNERITDDALVQLADMAQGQLECLSLVECPKITDDGLRRILEANRRLTKLGVPGCTRISIECIVNCVKAYNSNNEFGGIKQLRIGGLYGVNHDHFEELNSLLGSGDKNSKQHFYHRGNFYLPYDDDRPMDIEMCPRCEKFRLVYDCPSATCTVKDKSIEVCRACTLCIARCAQCGRCINDTEFEETFCLELLCSDCFKQMVKYQDKLDKKVDSSEAQCGVSY